jgi:hypothetical protein
MCINGPKKPHSGTKRQLETHLLEQITEQPDVLENIICDKMWIFQYNPETERKLTHWKTPTSLRMKKA